jgi:hypothetical protein
MTTAVLSVQKLRWKSRRVVVLAITARLATYLGHISGRALVRVVRGERLFRVSR